MTKKTAKPQHKFEDVTVTKGPLAGIIFKMVDHTPVGKNGRVTVKYVAPDEGPRAIVVHTAVRSEFRMEDRAEDVRIAFAKLLPANVLWSKENGYSDRKSGALLRWDRQLARFVLDTASAPVEPASSSEEN